MNNTYEDLKNKIEELKKKAVETNTVVVVSKPSEYEKLNMLPELSRTIIIFDGTF